MCGTLFERMTWIVRRLQAISLPEAVYRGRRLVSNSVRRLAGGAMGREGVYGRDLDGSHAFIHGMSPMLPILPFNIPHDHRARLLGGEVPCFWSWHRPGKDPHFWRRDPVSGTLWPDGTAKRIRYRPGNPHGDVRLVWELNRLQHLVALASIAHKQISDRERACGLIVGHLESWIEGNARPIGVNHLSAMEQALRLIAVAHTFDSTREWLPPRTRNHVLRILTSHARFIEENLSLYSSAGNHTIAEAVGLVYAGVLLPEHPRSATWLSRGLSLLQQEAPRQIRADGGPLEQSTGYLVLITDLLDLVCRLLIHTGRDPAPAVVTAVDRAKGFLTALAPGRSSLPAIGDGDDGNALSPYLDLPWPAQAPSPRSRQFPDTGITVVSFGSEDHLIFLHKDLGMPPNYGHGHGDALSLVFRWRGIDVLLDPGTGQYGGDPAVRRYFRSTAAHNTLTVQGADQARQAGPFMWRRPYESRVILSTLDRNLAAILATHNGYRDRGFTHWRGVFYQREAALAVWDYVAGPGAPDLVLHWHIGAPVSPTPDPGSFLIELHDGIRMRLTMPSGQTTNYEASRLPMAGWRSPYYGALAPCRTLSHRLDGPERREALTVFDLRGGMEESGQHLVGEDMEQWLNRFRQQASRPT